MKKVVEVLTIMAALFGVVVGGIQAYDWVFAPAGKLKAEIRYGHFKLPPSVGQNIDSLSMLMKLSDKKIDKLISINKIDPKSAEGVRIILEALSEAALKRIDSISLDVSFRTEGYWIINLVNDGNKEIKNVQVKTPAFSSALVTNEDGSTSLLKKEKMISLGDFQPSQKANIFVWAMESPREWDIEGIKIRHSEGFASMKFYMHISGLFAFLYINSTGIFFGFVIFLLALYGVIGVLESVKKAHAIAGKSSPKEKKAVEQPLLTPGE